MDEVLTEEVFRRAFVWDNRPPSSEPSMVLHPLVWEHFKDVFNVTETQMERWFVKSTYIEPPEG